MRTIILSISLLASFSIFAQERKIETMEDVRNVSKDYQASTEARVECDTPEADAVELQITTGMTTLEYRVLNARLIKQYYCGLTKAVNTNSHLEDGELASMISNSYVCGSVRAADSNLPFEIIPLNASSDAEGLANESAQIAAHLNPTLDQDKLKKLRSICSVAEKNKPNHYGFIPLTDRNLGIDLDENTRIEVYSDEAEYGVRVQAYF